MQSNSRITRKNVINRNRSDRRKENSLEIIPISLKRQILKLPSIFPKVSPKSDNTQIIKSPKKNSVTQVHSTPSPTSIISRASLQADFSSSIFTKKLTNPRIEGSNNTPTQLKQIKLSKNPILSTDIKSTRIAEIIKKIPSNFMHSSSSDISSSDDGKEKAKKFESPATRTNDISSIKSYISEYQNSNSHTLHKGVTFEEAEELNNTPDVLKYNELKFKLIVQDSLTDGIKGRLRRWKAGEMLGVGSYAQVFKAFDLESGELFAVKRILFNPNNIAQTKYIKDLEAEVSILQSAHNEHVVRYLGSEVIQDNFCIYLEYLPGGSLSKLLYNLGALSEITIRAYLIQILKGLVYLHNKGVIHRDIKGANILLDSKGKLKLSDFGCSKQYQSVDAESGFITSLIGTLPWMAPEVVKQKGYGRKADIWSLGCVALEMFTAKKPWDTEDNQVIFMMKIISENTIPHIPEGISEHAKDFLLSCFQRDPKARKSAKELLDHAFLKKLGT